MKKKPDRRVTQLALILLASLALTNSGCLVVAAGAAGGAAAAGYAYYKGKITETYAAGFTDSWAATQTALTELGMPILKEDRKGDTGTIETRTADDDAVRIYLEAVKSSIPAEDKVTQISVRVATFGDRPVSDRILYQIGLHLAPAGYTGIPAAQAPGAPGVIQTGAPGLAPAVPSTIPQQTAPPPLLVPEPSATRK
jgi:hypothetical protein